MYTRKNGFTIVEMIIVVVIIAVLALITVFAFGNWRARTARTEMKNETANGAIAAKNYRNFNGAYPTNQAGFDAIYKAGSSVTLTYSTADAGVTYCLKATSVNDTSIWYVGSAVPQPTTTKPATCP